MRDLFAAQSVDPAAAVGGDADGRRIDPGTPGPQETREIVHDAQYGRGPCPGQWSCRYQEVPSDGGCAPESRPSWRPESEASRSEGKSDAEEFP
ncbi:hypothetical protein GCM10018782_12870 [Streptomyces griseoaurantiacus]|nr:hypothetical protein GCM10018782_12870 [Streptomyces griseoaurantiacus]